MSRNLAIEILIAGVVLAVSLFIAYRKSRRRGVELPSPFAEIPLHQIEIDGFSIRYHQSGRGPTLLLIHGIGANLFCWRHLIPALAGRYTLIALDLPGFGQSSTPEGARYGLDDQVERVRLFLAKLGIGKCYLVGNSMGGNIALWFARAYPAQVRGTVVIAPATSPKLMPVSVERWLWLSKPLSHILNRHAIRWAHQRTVSKRDLVGADRVEETFKTYGQNAEAVRSFLLATESIRDARLAHALHEVRGRVLILWGSRDRLVSRAVIDLLEAQIPTAESFVHVGGGHHLQEDEPEWVAEKIDAFITDQPD